MNGIQEKSKASLAPNPSFWFDDQHKHGTLGVCAGRGCLLPRFHTSGDDNQNDSCNDKSDTGKECGTGYPPVPRQHARYGWGTTGSRTW